MKHFPDDVRSSLVLLSGADRGGLLAVLDRLIAGLSEGRPSDPSDLIAQAGHPERLALIVPPGKLGARLTAAREQLGVTRKARLAVRDQGLFFGSGVDSGRVVFLFPGEGSQRVGMLRDAFQRLAPVEAWFGALDETYLAEGEQPPSRLIYPPADLDPEQAEADRRALLDIGHGAQLCTVANLALFEVLGDLGIVPDAVLGHSNGEHAAAIAACMDVGHERARICRWLRLASRAGQAVPPPRQAEAMAAVSALNLSSLETIVSGHPGTLFVAMDNCPMQQVIGGTLDAVAAAAKTITALGGICRTLPFERAYHTPLFAAWAAALNASYKDLALATPRLPIVSCLSGAPLPADPVNIRRAMTRQWTAMVGLRQAVEALYGEGFRTFIEVGPDGKLTNFVRDTLRDRPHLACSAALAGQNDLTQLGRMVALLHAQGLTIDGDRVNRLIGPAPLSPPPPQRPSPARTAGLLAQRALVAAARGGLARMERLYSIHHTPMPARPASAGRLAGPLSFTGRGLVGRRRLCRRTDPLLADHSFGRPPARPLPVLSFTTSLVIAAEAARHLSRVSGQAVLTDIQAQRWLRLDDGTLDLALVAEHAETGIYVSLSEVGVPPAFTTTVSFAQSAATHATPMVDLGPLRPPQCWSPAAFYRDYAFHGPRFQGLDRVTGVGPGGIEGQLRVSAPSASTEGDPALLDCVGQLVAFWLLEEKRLPPTIGAFPYTAREIILYGPPPPPGTPVTCRVAVTMIGQSYTRADAVLTAAGRLVATVDGQQQRLLRLPDAVARHLFGQGGGRPLSPGRGIASAEVADWARAIRDHGEIWASLLAHAVLDDASFIQWQQTPDSAWLLARAAHRSPVGVVVG